MLCSILGFGNDLTIHNQERLLGYLKDEGRSRGFPLLTLCNHASMLDDPALVCKFLLSSILGNVVLQLKDFQRKKMPCHEITE